MAWIQPDLVQDGFEQITSLNPSISGGTAVFSGAISDLSLTEDYAIDVAGGLVSSGTLLGLTTFQNRWCQTNFQSPFVQLAGNTYTPVGGLHVSGGVSPVYDLIINVSGGLTASGSLTPFIGTGLTSYNFTVGGLLRSSGSLANPFNQYAFVPIGGFTGFGSADDVIDFTPAIGVGSLSASGFLTDLFADYQFDVFGGLVLFGNTPVHFNPFVNATLTADTLRVFERVFADQILIRPT